MGQRTQLRLRAEGNPNRFETHLDPTPMEESLNNPPRETMRDVVAQYVRSMRPEPPLSEVDVDDFVDQDPEEMVITQYQEDAALLEVVYDDDDIQPPPTEDISEQPSGPDTVRTADNPPAAVQAEPSESAGQK